MLPSNTNWRICFEAVLRLLSTVAVTGLVIAGESGCDPSKHENTDENRPEQWNRLAVHGDFPGCVIDVEDERGEGRWSRPRVAAASVESQAAGCPEAADIGIASASLADRDAIEGNEVGLCE